jgi:carbohydrate kinase (thermoresistant glucokinase family)
MGVAGSGKSTLGGALAAELGWDLGEGDELHPASNIAKMAAGRPLTDADRAPWLQRVRAWIDEHLAAGTPGIVTCSALKRAYRDVLRDPHVVFVYLAGSRDVLAARLTARHGHFMPAALLDSQLADLEPPEDDERALVVDITTDLADQVATITTRLALT